MAADLICADAASSYAIVFVTDGKKRTPRAVCSSAWTATLLEGATAVLRAIAPRR